MASTNNQPNTTLYINNLNDRITTDELRSQLYALFTTYGKIIEIVACKSPKMRGQAFLVFSDLADATTAMRACEGMMFYEKPLRIAYAKAKSYATRRREDPNFVPPSAHANPHLLQEQQQNNKRPHDGDTTGERAVKRDKVDEDEEEMEIDDDDENKSAQQRETSSAPPTSVPQQVFMPTARLLCTNLPQEVSEDVLSVLFQQYQGFQSIHVTWSPTPSATGARVKMAQVIFETPELATTAKEAVDGFSLKKDWHMSVVYI